MNSATGPSAGGFDLLVGQSLTDGRHGQKTADFYDPASKTRTPMVTLNQWVKPTGGEYLFAPPRFARRRPEIATTPAAARSISNAAACRGG